MLLVKPNVASKVAAAKDAAKKKGAPDVGLIDTDSFESLPPGNFIVYSGQYDSKAKAADALSKLDAEYGALYRTEDFVEGRRAEAEGRPPRYQGK